MKRLMSHWQTRVLVGVTVLLMLLPATVSAGNPNPGVLPPNSHPYGKNYAQWSARWWQWAMSIPYSSNPIFDQTGADCSLKQSGSVWFLAGGSANAGALTRTCTIPSGKAVLFPIINLLNDYPCPPQFNFEPAPGQSLQDFLTNGNSSWPSITQYLEPVTGLAVTVDGVPLQNLSNYRVTSGLFTFTGDPSLTSTFDPCITGMPEHGVSYGYWIMLAPLSVGNHSLHFHAEAQGMYAFTLDVTYALTVTP